MDNSHPSLVAAVLNTAVDSIVLIDEWGKIQSVNPATQKMFGYASEELIGKNVSMLMPSPYREGHDQYLADYCRTGVAKIIGIGREVTGRRKDGSVFPMHLAVSEIQTQQGRMFAGIVRDISAIKAAQDELTALNEDLERRVQERTTELKAAQAELLKQEKLATLGKVSGGIAHEIRNPLNAVKTSAYYLLNAKSPAPEKVREHLERIDRQVTSIDNVITALTDVARMPTPNVGQCGVRNLIESVVANVEMAPEIEIRNEILESLAPVRVDANQLAIVFRNLIRNARDAMAGGGILTLSASAVGPNIHVRVADTGTGIPPENLQRITEPLFSTKARGMGLGLAISDAILQRNGGTMRVESQLGHGTVFTVILPRGESRHEEPGIETSVGGG